MNVDIVRNWQFPVIRQSYSERDTILYALALGYGTNPTDPAELQYVYERNLKAVPTMATALCHPGPWMANRETGINFKRVVNGEQRMRIHAPLPVKGSVRGEANVIDIVDKGKDKGALVVWRRRLHDDDTNALLAVVEQVTMCRDDGGFSASSANPASQTGAPATGESGLAPDHTVDIQTLPQAALIYRLSADLNPLHADPEVAKEAGFDRPILHGLATYGIAGRALVQACCANELTSLRQLDARFSSPVFPGELIRTEIWMEAGNARFRCVALKRGVVVIANGSAQFAQP